MTNTDHTYFGRRSVLKGSGIALAGLGGLATPVAAKGGKGERTTLRDGPTEFQLFWSGVNGPPTVADGIDDFGYPAEPDDMDGSPFLASEDPDDTPPNDKGGLFNAADIEMTPNGKTLHHHFRPFGGVLMEGDRGKPYTLVNHGLLLGTPFYQFVAEGQLLNFDAVDMDELSGLMESIGGLHDPIPIMMLAGGTWRAVGREIIYVLQGDDGKPSRLAPFSVTRVDFYDRSVRPMEFALSILYLLYPNLNENGNPTPADPENPNIQKLPDIAHATGMQFIKQGPRNPGGR